MDWKTSIRPLDDAEAAARWRVLMHAAPQRSPFSSLAYARAVADTLGFSSELVLVGREASTAAGVVVFSRRRGPLQEALVPPFTPFTSFVLSGTLDEASVHARRSPFDALLAALEARYDRLSFHLSPSLLDVRTCLWRGWQARPLYTYRLPLTDEATLLAAWSEGPRRLFRKSRASYCIRESPSAAGAVAALCAASYARQQRRFPTTIPRAEALIASLEQAGLVRIFTAAPRSGGGLEAGVAVLYDEQTAYYWMAGSTPGAAMTVLLGEMLPQLSADGLQTFDFVGANTPPIAEFKRRLGPTLTPYFRVEKDVHALFHLLRLLRRA